MCVRVMFALCGVCAQAKDRFHVFAIHTIFFSARHDDNHDYN